MFPVSTASFHRHRYSLIQTISAKLLVFNCTFSSKYRIPEIWRHWHKFPFMHVSFLFINGYFNFEYGWKNTCAWFTFLSSDVTYKSKSMFHPLLEHTARALCSLSTRGLGNQPLCLSIYPLCVFILWNLSSSGVEKHSGHNLHLNDSPLYIILHVGIR